MNRLSTSSLGGPSSIAPSLSSDKPLSSCVVLPGWRLTKTHSGRLEQLGGSNLEIHPRRLTWNLKILLGKGEYKSPILGFHVNFKSHSPFHLAKRAQAWLFMHDRTWQNLVFRFIPNCDTESSNRLQSQLKHTHTSFVFRYYNNYSL